MEDCHRLKFQILDTRYDVSGSEHQSNAKPAVESKLPTSRCQTRRHQTADLFHDHRAALDLQLTQIYCVYHCHKRESDLGSVIFAPHQSRISSTWTGASRKEYFGTLSHRVEPLYPKIHDADSLSHSRCVAESPIFYYQYQIEISLANFFRSTLSHTVMEMKNRQVNRYVP